jgi:hypothetical protein
MRSSPISEKLSVFIPKTSGQITSLVRKRIRQKSIPTCLVAEIGDLTFVPNTQSVIKIGSIFAMTHHLTVSRFTVPVGTEINA